MKLLSLQKKLRPILQPAGMAYKMLMSLRRRLYGHRLIVSYLPAAPCISIGNISWGGTGKTPLVDWLLGWAEAKKIKAAVLTRGYKSLPKSSPLLVTHDSSPGEAGDEPLFLAQRHPDAAVIVFPKRSVAARFAEEHIRPDLFILDDAMQHLGIARHVNLVLLHPRDLTEQWNAVLPAGTWREGKEALSAATAFAMKIDESSLEELTFDIDRRLARFHVPFFPFSLEICCLIPLSTYPASPLHCIEKTSFTDYTFITGIAEPDQAIQAITRFTGTQPSIHMVFPDHHTYTAKDVHKILTCGLPVICTGKDAEKLRSCLPRTDQENIFVACSHVCFNKSLLQETPETFPQWWERTWLQLARTTPFQD